MIEFIDLETLGYRVKSEDKVLLIFETPWCEKCEEFMGEFSAIPEGNLSCPVFRVEVDLDGGEYIKRKYRIKETPVAVLFESGKEIDRTSFVDMLKILIT